MPRDTFDMFQPPIRSRFGDNEYADDRTETQKAKSNLIDVEVTFRQDGTRAIAVTKFSTANEPYIWLPKSLIEFDGKPGDRVVVTMPRWVALEKGLIDFAHGKTRSQHGGSSS